MPRSPLRPGPRPLVLHLVEQALITPFSQIALPAWRNGSAALRPHLQPASDHLRSQVASVDPEVFSRVLMQEGCRRLDEFLSGVEAYRRHPYRRAMPDAPVLWREGATRLLDYGAAEAPGPAVLVVPSLINRGYILDLAPRLSLVRHLAAKGLRPILVDWGMPGAVEADFDLTAYVAGRLGRVLDLVLARFGRPVVLGYCMGGLLALGLAQLRAEAVAGLILLATPWDFHQPSPDQARKVESLAPVLTDLMALCGHLPVDALQCLFSTIDPGGIGRKFRHFAHVKRASAKARTFVAVEDWLNDGVPLVRRVAEECLTGWYIENRPARGGWTLAGQVVRPQDLRLPCLAVIPADDRIVPPQSALALAERIPGAKRRVVPAGHIGMVTGRRARGLVYSPMAKWIYQMRKD